MQQLHWRSEVAQALAGIEDELGDAAANAAEQQAAGPCIDRQLALLEARLTAPGSYRPAPLYTDATPKAFTVRAPSRG